MGQFIQSGSPIFFETIVDIKKPNQDLQIHKNEQDLDQLNYLCNKTMHQINEIALAGTLDAHSNPADGNTPNIVLEWETMNAKMFGYAVYFFMKACAVSAYLLGVNPFDQPGVEVYKKNMFALLGKK